jgi:hypothetical protein
MAQLPQPPSGEFPPLRPGAAGEEGAQEAGKTGWSAAVANGGGMVGEGHAPGLNGNVNGHANGVNGQNAVDAQASAGSAASVANQDDPDFPRRTPNRTQLYDPSAKTHSRPPSTAPTITGSTAPGRAPLSVQAGVPASAPAAVSITPGMTPEEVIEAKLQALSVSVGVTIGPPPVRSATGVGASYAKAVRRE